MIGTCSIHITPPVTVSKISVVGCAKERLKVKKRAMNSKEQL